MLSVLFAASAVTAGLDLHLETYGPRFPFLCSQAVADMPGYALPGKLLDAVFRPDSRTIVVVTTHALGRHDIPTGRTRTVAVFDTPTAWARFSHDGRTLVRHRPGRDLVTHDPDTGMPVRSAALDDDDAEQLELSPSGRHLALTRNSDLPYPHHCRIRIVSVADGRELCRHPVDAFAGWVSDETYICNDQATMRSVLRRLPGDRADRVPPEDRPAPPPPAIVIDAPDSPGRVTVRIQEEAGLVHAIRSDRPEDRIQMASFDRGAERFPLRPFAVRPDARGRMALVAGTLINLANATDVRSLRSMGRFVSEDGRARLVRGRMELRPATDRFLSGLLWLRSPYVLDLTGCGTPGLVGVRLIAASPGLQGIIVSGDGAAAVIDALADGPHAGELRELDVSACGRHPPGLARLLKRTPRMRRLMLGPHVDADVIRAIAGMAGLEEISARGAGVDDALLRALAGKRELRIVELADAAVTDAGMVAVGAPPHLDVLRLSGCGRLTGAGLRELRRCAELVELDLTGAGVDDEGMAAIGGITSLQDLRLGGSLTDAGLRHLGELGELRSLVLGGVDGVTGAGLPDLPELRQLDLSQTRTDDDGLRVVGRLRGLESLDLSGTRITDTGVEHLLGLTSLTRLNASGTGLTPECGHILGALPRLHETDVAGTVLLLEGMRPPGRLDDEADHIPARLPDRDDRLEASETSTVMRLWFADGGRRLRMLTTEGHRIGLAEFPADAPHRPFPRPSAAAPFSQDLASVHVGPDGDISGAVTELDVPRGVFSGGWPSKYGVQHLPSGRYRRFQQPIWNQRAEAVLHTDEGRGCLLVFRTLGTAEFIDTAGRRPPVRFRVGEHDERHVVLEPHARRAVPAAVCDRGRMLALNRDATIELHPLRAPSARAWLEGHRSPVRELAASPDGELLVSASNDEIRLWNVARVKCLHARIIHTPRGEEVDSTLYRAITFSPAGDLVAVTVGRHVHVMSTRAPWRYVMLDGGADITATAFTPDGTALVGTHRDGNGFTRLATWRMTDLRPATQPALGGAR